MERLHNTAVKENYFRIIRRAVDPDPHGSAFVSFLDPDPHSICISGSRGNFWGKNWKNARKLLRSNCNFILFLLDYFGLAVWFFWAIFFVLLISSQVNIFQILLSKIRIRIEKNSCIRICKKRMRIHSPDFAARKSSAMKFHRTTINFISFLFSIVMWM